MFKQLLGVLFLVLLMCGSAFATDYYIKNGGDDAKSGLDDANAWENISKLEGSFNAGDNIYLKKGSTWVLGGADVDWDSNGSSGSPILITSYGSGNDPVIVKNSGTWAFDIEPSTAYLNIKGLKFTSTGVDATACDVALAFQDGANNCHVDSCTIEGFRHYGLSFATPGDRCTVTNSSFDDNGNAIYYIDEATSGSGSSYHLVAGNTFADTNSAGDYLNIGTGQPYDGHVVGMQAVNYMIVRDNTSTGSYRAIGLWADRDVVGHVVYYNNVFKNGGTSRPGYIFSPEDNDTLGHVICYRNVVDNTFNPFRLAKDTTGTAYIFNNTAYGGSYGFWLRRGADNLKFVNNIIHSPALYFWYKEVDFYTSTGIETDYNLYYSASTPSYLWSSATTSLSAFQTQLGGCPNTGNECDSITTDPLLVDPANDDFTITSSGSSAIDAGTILATIDSATEAGGAKVFSVGAGEAGYFHGGFGITDIDGTPEVGQTIRLYDSTNGYQEAVVDSVDYSTDEITVTANKLWVQNVTTVALNYAGVAPDIGYYEYAGEPEHPDPLVVVVPSTSTYTTGDTVTYGSTLTFYDSATVDTITWNYGGQDEAVAGLSTGVEDPGGVVHTETGAFNQSLVVTDSLGGSTTVEWTLTVQAADSYDDLTFFETFEVDPQSAYFDYSAGDSDAAYTDAVLHADAAYKGAKGLNCTGVSSYAKYDTNISNIYDGNDIAIGFAFKVSTWNDLTDLITLYEAAHKIIVELVSTDEVRFLVDSDAQVYLTSSGASLVVDTWYIARIVIDPATEERTLYIYNTALTQLYTITNSGTPFSALNAPAEMWVGNHSAGDAGDVYIDNLVISLDKTDPVHEWVQLTKYPKGKWIDSITQVSPDGTYGESDTIQCSVNLNPLCGGGTVTDTDAGSDNDMTLSSTLDVGAALAWTADSAYDTALYHHLFTATVVADTTEADLTITTLADNADTADFDLTTIPTNLAASAAIVIDTTANTFITLFHSDSSGTIIAGAATYTSGYFYITLQGSGGEYLQFKDGPLSNIAPTLALSYGTSLTGTVFSGLDGTTDLIVCRYDVDDVDGARIVTGIMGESALPHGATVICDISPAENPVSSYNYPDTTAITGGVITIAAPSTFTVTSINTPGTYVLWVPGDDLTLITTTDEAIDTAVSGTSPLIIGLHIKTPIMTALTDNWTIDEDYWDIEGHRRTYDGTMTDTGTGNTATGFSRASTGTGPTGFWMPQVMFMED